ncbi:B-cell antigen receptor complex-associated protein alpha chain [Discoglossus pictus]
MQLFAGSPQWRYQIPLFLLLLQGKHCWGLKMKWVSPSQIVNVGEEAKLECNFELNSSNDIKVTWLQMQQLGDESKKIPVEESIAYTDGRIKDKERYLTIQRTQKNDSALYICKVTAEKQTKESCGTFLRVKDPGPFIFLKIGESTKNRVITVEGVILLLCAVIPGTFLLYKKRWENLKVLSLKQPEENLYEGLNLEDCSMYEDITRGLQATYEDVGTIRATDFQLEKP